jgi:RNA polymerase sigma-70 factor (ECF subfamily)
MVEDQPESISMEIGQQIWTELGATVRRFVASRVRDVHEADDITQDVMLKVHSHLAELPPAGNLPAWMIAIARNALIDHYRAKSVREHADIDQIKLADDDRAAGHDVDDDDDNQRALRELAPCIGRMIELLPEPYCQALKLTDIDGLTQQQLAERVGISLSGAKSRVQRARQQMRAMIERCCRIDLDARGNIMDYHPTDLAHRYCQRAGDDGRPCGE